MTTITLKDAEFGTVAIRCNPRARRVILRVKHDASVHITVPHKRHLKIAEQLLEDSRQTVRVQRQALAQKTPRYEPGVMVGRNHQLIFRAQASPAVAVRVTEERIIVSYPFSLTPQDEIVQQKIRPAVKRALRRQAASYLPVRLARLASMWGFDYKEARVSSGHTRWGSCSSDNVISLNLSLMTLPDHLIDYVICHELCHTKEHNHSDRFWQLVETFMPDWRTRRKELKEEHPF